MRLFREVAIETPCIGVYQGTPCRCSDRGYYKTRQDKDQDGYSMFGHILKLFLFRRIAT